MKQRRTFYITVAVAIFLFLTIIVIVLAKYKTDSETVSANYPNSIPATTRNDIARQLRNLIGEKFGVSNSGAVDGVVREDSIKETNGELKNIEFLIDIDLVKQTYLVNATWSDTETVSDGIIISCPPKSAMKYSDAICQSMYDNSEYLQNIHKYPLYNELPIIIDSFDFASRTDIKYEIRGYFENQKLILTVIDYSGGNYDKAIQKIRELGYNPSDYEIKYNDQSQN